MKAVDIFCGAGGATRGLQHAGFYVAGIDIDEQPRYCGNRFWRGDATKLDIDFLRQFDLIWASPPCQPHTSMRSMHNAKRHVDFIPRTREMLQASGVPYVIENVVGAPLVNPITLCGTVFGLRTPCGADLQRHRLFEASFKIDEPLCSHCVGRRVIGIYGGHYRDRQRPAGVNRGVRGFTAEDGKAAMRIDWMTGDELSQAIPPAFSEYVARQFLHSVGKGY